MNKTTEALKLAGLIEASVEECMGDDGMVAVIPLDLYNDLMAAIREALAEPVKRPQNCGTGYCSCIECPYEPVKQEPVIKNLDLIEKGRILAANQRNLDLTAGKNVAKVLDELCDHILELYTAPVQPVKQEPVACIRWIPKLENVRSEYFEYGWSDGKKLPVGTQLYALPVDAKAIRAEALEEAAKWFEESKFYKGKKDLDDISEATAAALRRLK